MIATAGADVPADHDREWISAPFYAGEVLTIKETVGASLVIMRKLQTHAAWCYARFAAPDPIRKALSSGDHALVAAFYGVSRAVSA